MIELSVIVPTFQRSAILARTLRALREAARNLSCEIIVVNDSKISGVAVETRSIVVLDNPGSGAASARNYGAKRAKGRLLVFLDDDIIVSERSLRRTLELHSRNPQAAINPDWRYTDEILAELDRSSFGRFLLNAKLIDYRGWVPDLKWQDGSLFEVQKLAAFYLSIERRAFELAGGFNESFANQGIEDDELCLRLRRQGVRLLIDSSELVRHNEVDRMSLAAKLNRLKTGACNRRHAVELGMEECRIVYSLKKKALWRLLSPLKPVLLATCSVVPNRTSWDPLYRKLANALFGVVIFEGYHGRDNRPLQAPT